MYELFLERGTEKKLAASSESIEFLTAFVTNIEDTNNWPEGYDAVMYDPTGRSWYYEDGWKEIKPLDGGPDESDEVSNRAV